MSEPPVTPETILVYVGLDLLGDGLMKLPFARALRNAYPEARITWLAGKGRTVYAGKLKPLVAPLIDEVIEEAGIGRRWSELLTRPLPGRRFDLILDSQRRLRTTLILRRIDHGRFVSGCTGYLFSDLRPPGALTFSYRKPPAVVGQMLELLALACGGRPDAPLDLSGGIRLPEEVGVEAARLLPEGGRYVGLAPGAGDRRRRWPLDNFIALGKRLTERGLTPVFLLGPEERDLAAPLRAGLPQARLPLEEPEAALDLEPLLTIALAARCALCVANDSGNGHLLATAGVPLVWLCGPTPPEKFAPRVPGLSVIRAQDFGDSEMAAIPLDAVEKAVLSACGA
jgi:ADP-heptose:LPS heptosyltransferase